MPLFFGIVTRNYGIVPACCRHTYRVKSSCAAVTVAICCKSSLAVVLSRCWWWWHRLLQHMRCLFIFLWFVVAKVICSCKAAIRGTEIGVPRCTAAVSVAVYMLPAGWWLTGAGGCCHRSAPILAAGSWRLALGLKCDMCAPFALLFCFEYELYTSNFPLSFAHILCRYWCYDCCRSKLWFPQTRRSPLAIRWPHATAIISVGLSVCACCCCWHHLLGVPQLRLVVVAAFENCQWTRYFCTACCILARCLLQQLLAKRGKRYGIHILIQINMCMCDCNCRMRTWRTQNKRAWKCGGKCSKFWIVFTRLMQFGIICALTCWHFNGNQLRWVSGMLVLPQMPGSALLRQDVMLSGRARASTQPFPRLNHAFVCWTCNKQRGNNFCQLIANCCNVIDLR